MINFGSQTLKSIIFNLGGLHAHFHVDYIDNIYDYNSILENITTIINFPSQRDQDNRILKFSKFQCFCKLN